MKLHEVLQQAETIPLKQNGTVFSASTFCSGHKISIALNVISNSLVYVLFDVDDSYLMDGKKTFKVALSTMQFVVSCISSLDQQFPGRQYYFGADAAHEKAYDKMLPMLTGRYNFTYEKQPYNDKLDTTLERLNKRFSPLYSKKKVEMTAVYFITPKNKQELE